MHCLRLSSAARCDHEEKCKQDAILRAHDTNELLMTDELKRLSAAGIQRTRLRFLN